MFPTAVLVSFTLLALSHGQQIGTNMAENHPPLSISTCTSGGSCTTEDGAIVIDANWRWTHNVGGSTNCYTGNTWDETLCPDPETCATNCAVDGADYTGTYGITANGDSLTLKFVTQSQQKNIGSRVYLMEDDDNYRLFSLKNNEFTFDVDVSQLGCGLNGALYFVEMDQDGGKSRFATNKAGARYGTGYCDSQCAQDIKFIDGVANVVDWTPSDSDPNSGTGSMGTCCAEMDIWEANSVSAAFTPHVCTVSGQTSCTGTDCGAGDERYDGVCDKDGCDFNSFRMGDTSFYGEGLTVDTTQPFTVITQFVTNDNTTSGTLVEIRRLYVQNGQVIQNSKTAIQGMDAFDSVTDEFCNAQKTAFDDTNSFEDRGGLGAMSKAMDSGMVLVMSLWDDHAANMLWLDSDYPLDRSASQPGVSRGTCEQSSGVPADVESQAPNSQVVFSNIKFGPIGSTF